MGACVCAKQNRRLHGVFDREPPDTLNLRGRDLPKLVFQGALGNVKIKQCPQTETGVCFRIGDLFSFDLKPKMPNNEHTAKWKFQERFQLSLTEYQLRKHFLNIQFLTASGISLGSIRINLYLISIGPYHQDFAVGFQGCGGGRVSFDLKMSQVIDVCIQSAEAEIDLWKKHPGEQFCYSIKTIVGCDGSSAESEHSCTAMVLLNRLHGSLKELPQGGPAEKTSDKKYSTNINPKSRAQECQNNLTWTNQALQPLPAVNITILASELHNTYFQILLWKVSEKQSEQKEAAKLSLFADCYVSFHKLFGTEPTQLCLQNQMFERRTINMVEKVWHHGKECGKATFVFHVQNQKYIKQHQICVRTEEGIMKTAPIFGIAETRSSESCSQLTELLKISAEAEASVINLDKLQSLGAPSIQVRKSKIAIQNSLSSMQRLLVRSSVQAQVSYRYSSEKELIKAQKILIEIGMKVTEYLQEQDPLINDLCWMILIALVQRGQFSLTHMGFNDTDKKLIEQGTLTQSLKRKQQVAIMYKLFLHKLLQLALKSLNLKGSEWEQKFAEVFCAYAYFRIPQFRREILCLITNECDPEITEWRGIEFNLHEDITERWVHSDVNTFTLLFDWGKHFYKYLVSNEHIENANINLADILAQEAWRQRFIRRGLAFFYFLIYWVNYVLRENESSIAKEIQWRYFPGYNRLLRGYFVEMKTRDILEYPESMIEAGKRLMANENLLNTFVSILFNQANIYRPLTVIKALDFISRVLGQLQARRKIIPITFNYINFFKGLKVVLEGDFAFAISNTLILLYSHYHLFHYEFRMSISMYLLGKMFFRLFLHWSTHVRSIFYHLLIYRIDSDVHLNNGKGKGNADTPIRHEQQIISDRYHTLLSILQSQELVRPQGKTLLLVGKDLHKRMKIKIYEKRRRRTETNAAEDEIGTELSMAVEQSQPDAQIKIFRSIQDLPQRQRFYSEVLSKSLVICYNQESVSRNIPFRKHRKTEDFSLRQVPDLKTTLQSGAMLQSLLSEEEFNIQEIETKQRVYIRRSLAQFRAINQSCLGSHWQSSLKVPLLKHEMAIDKQQIQPDQIDDW